MYIVGIIVKLLVENHNFFWYWSAFKQISWLKHATKIFSRLAIPTIGLISLNLAWHGTVFTFFIFRWVCSLMMKYSVKWKIFIRGLLTVKRFALTPPPPLQHLSRQNSVKKFKCYLLIVPNKLQFWKWHFLPIIRLFLWK